MQIGPKNGQALAEELAQARLTASMLELPDDFLGRPRTEIDGYDVQNRTVQTLCRKLNADFAGYKVGLVSKEIREQCGGAERLGVDWPVFGSLLSTHCFSGTAKVRLIDLVQPSVECEIAVQIGEDVPAGSLAYDRESIAPFVSHCMAAIELVDFHLPFFDYSSPLAPLFIADNGSNWGCVVGTPVSATDLGDITELRGTLLKNGKPVASGQGRDLLGHPYEVLAWLQNHLFDQSRSLRKGEIVMLGSVTPNFRIQTPCEIRVDWEKLGSAAVDFI
jgi:2-keto-4-pentenoate hydratase